MKLVIFEDDTYAQLFPLTILRPVFEMKCGASSLGDKILRHYGGVADEVIYFFRDELADVFAPALDGKVNDIAALAGEDVLFVNGRWLVSEADPAVASAEEACLRGGSLVYAFAKSETVEKCV
ncbi:MAG: putative sugar nucleotidyl transferase, partial [Planctomycetia bacterium]|nr:putative sugar nucleotidyl transferase [Planctomycetia bacterium]